jgi:hypothetical protein
MLHLLLIGREKKKKKRKEKWLEGLFSQARPCWLCHAGFSLMLGAIKG